jgi:hypothetical protein
MKKGSTHLKWIEETFSTPPDDSDKEVLHRYKINYDLNMLIICYDCINYYDDFNSFTGIPEHIYSICLVVYYYSLTLHEDIFICFI